MKKHLPFFVLFLTFCGYSQNQWTKINQTSEPINKNVLRASFPKDFQLFTTSIAQLNVILNQAPPLLSAQNSNSIITIPNSSGVFERYEIFEYSNFAPELQSQFPQIKSFAGKGIDDKAATIRLSSDPTGIQAMIFRTGKRNEFIEPYSADGAVYVVYESSRNKGQLPFVCSTNETQLSTELATTLPSTQRSSNPELLNFRLALSCNGEYATYHGGTVAGALAAMNATMTRVNGVFEKDLAIHMTIIGNNADVIYTNASTDPYSTTLSQWNAQLQTTLTTIIGEANYDVGHMFGASGGGGNAGCIGCVCVDGSKGRGITSPSDGVPMGDTFDIDYVAHELGHQFGGNHSFSHNVEGTGVNVEPGSGSTIMGYAGITAQDVQPHSDDYFVYASVKQIQDNMVGKTCPTRTNLTHGAPVVNAGSNYTIPKSTPFVLTGTATDSNNDVLSYCWEQNDAATSQTGANSAAIITKTGGPNWRSYSPVATPVRYFPRIQSVIANSNTTAGSEINVEALSAVARTLNFVLTARDSYPGGGLTGSDATVVTVNATAGPFLVTAPNTSVNWSTQTQQNVTWNVAGTTANSVNTATVDIYLSTDGGFTYPITLATDVANDGSQTITVPNLPGTTNRIMVKGHNHIFFDISNTNFTIVESVTDFTIAPQAATSLQSCKGVTISQDIQYTTYSGFSANTTFTATGQPAGATVAFSPNPIAATGIVTMTISNTSLASPGNYVITVTATSGSIVKNLTYNFQLFDDVFAAIILTAPANFASGQPTALNLTWVEDLNATSYDIQVSTDVDFTTFLVDENVATNSYALSGLSDTTNYFWKVKPNNPSCSGVFSDVFRFTTEQNPCSDFISTNVPITISATGTPTVTSTLTIPTINNVAIADINVTVNISHTYTSDLTVTLISPNNTQVNLVANQCGSNNNITATFDDAGIALVCGTTPAISGIVAPSQLLAAFNGENSEGIWSLRVVDNANADGGAINSWSLNICSAPIPFVCGQITTTWNGTSWSNGKPQDNVATTINGNFTSTENFAACSLDILGTSQVVLASGFSTTVAGAVNVSPNASLTIQNNANLIQIENVANNANATVYRDTNPLMRLDYTIWSSPVAGAQTLKSFSPLTLNNRFYDYNTTTNLYNVNADPITQTFETAKGYLIRMPDNHPTTPTIWNGIFTGNLNNGTIDANLTYIGIGQNFNMIGNPYPSTIDADTFISDNLSDITGTLYFWRKINNAAGTAYATYTLGGATTTSPTSPTPNGSIQVGQGFFVAAKDVVNPKATFLNTQRIDNNLNQFFRNATVVDQNRVWLNLTNTNGLFAQTMIGYMTDATDGYDALFDGKSINDSPIAFTSLLNNDEFAIQLNGLPLATTDVFQMLFKTDVAGNYTINLDHVDGLFSQGQDVFLRDNLVQQVHNLTLSGYNFTSDEGVFNTRFDVIFEANLLSTSNTEFNSNAVIAYTNNNQVYLNSSNYTMNKVMVFDTLGRLLFSSDKLSTTNFVIADLNAKNQALFVSIELENGQKVVKKIAY